MQPLILLAVVGVASVTLSMGFLMPEIPIFNLQQVAINERTFSTPITTANVDIQIEKTESRLVMASANGLTTDHKSVFFNMIKYCSFHTPSTGLGDGSKIICKLSDADGDIVAEGNILLPNGLAPSERTLIPILMTAFTNANEVQNIMDIKIVVQGTDPTLP